VDFNKIKDYLNNIEVKLKDEDKTLLLLNVLSKMYMNILKMFCYLVWNIPLLLRRSEPQ